MKILITGATNGMGKGVAKILASADDQAHEIIILCRSKELGQATIKEFEAQTGNNKTSIVLCDLTNFRDLKNAIDEIKANHSCLDAIFINAGMGYAPERVKTKDGMDPHFQVNYLSHFMLTIHLLELLERSEIGARVIFNTTKGGQIYRDDMQMEKGWTYVKAIQQAMVAKRMLLAKLHRIYTKKSSPRISFVGFHISQTVRSNQLNIIPLPMKIMASIMKFFGQFISIEKCGEIMAPLFLENQNQSFKRSGKFITWKKGAFVDIDETQDVLDPVLQDKLRDASIELCADDETTKIAESFC